MWFRFSTIHELRRQHAVGSWRGMNHQKSRRTLFSSPVQREPSNYSLPLFWGSGQGCPRLRASNEHILIVRVLQAKRAPGRPPHPSQAARSASKENMPALSPSSSFLQEGGLHWSPTARVQRGESATARCASTGDQSGLPPLILLVSCDPGVCIIRHRYSHG